RVPGAQSVTHRALLLGAWAQGETSVRGANPGADCAALAGSLASLGATVQSGPSADPDSGLDFRLRGVAGAWREPGGVLDLGNSGTAMRLLAGSVATADVFCILDGDRSLRSRPMARIVEPLRR